jgi:hypothetical protein
LSKTYLALGDSMSIDLYTEVIGGGAAAQFYRSLGPGWTMDDQARNGFVMEVVPRDRTGDVITLTIGGNDLLVLQIKYLLVGLDDFAAEHLDLLSAIRERNPDAVLIVGTIYGPQGGLDPRREALLDEANEVIRRNVKEVGGRLADIRERFRGQEDNLLCRMIEPNLKGATAIAELFREALRGDTAMEDRSCPECGSTEVAEILYGLFDRDPSDVYRDRRVVPGGCVVFSNSPTWRCLGCKAEWGQR